MDGRLLRLAPVLLTLTGCVNFPGILSDGRHKSTVVDAAIWRRPTNFLADRRQDPVLELAQRVTHVEDDLRRDGTITIKQPDVWGDANLMEYQQEYDKQMTERTGEFNESIQAFIASSDNAVVSAETSLAAALGGGTAAQPQLNQVVKINDIDPFTLLDAAKNSSATDKLSLEPTEIARQQSVYIDVCQALRRRHLGDDNSRSAGYGLYKIRIPVSVLPGRETSEGYSALVTLQAKPVVNSALLRYTFPKLAVADLVDTLTPNVREMLIKDSQEVGLVDGTGKTSVLLAGRLVAPNTPTAAVAATVAAAADFGAQSLPQELQGDSKVGRPQLAAPAASLPSMDETARGAVPPATSSYQLSLDPNLSNNTREAESPDLKNFITEDNLKSIVAYVKQDMQLYHIVGSPKDEDIRPSLFKLFGEVQIVLEQQQIYSLFGDRIHDLGRKVLLGRYDDVEQERAIWITEINQLTQFKPDQSQAAWLLALQFGVLNQNLKRIAVRLGQEGKLPGVDVSLYDNCHVQFYNLDSGNEAQTVELWRGIIETEFPLYVFSLDPQFEEQTNIEALTRRRQLQLALAFSVAKQPFNSASKIAASRQLALDESTIGLNRTIVSFSHGSDTFGWYFRPRLQVPPVESTNIGALARTIWSTGPTESYDLRHRKLEPGTRECEALIVMPSFVREVAFNVTSNWESLCKPGVTKRSYEEMMVQGRAVHELKACMPNLNTAACYRAGDVDRLIQRIDQLDTMLGMQTYTTKLPYKYEQSGNGLFGQGRNNLKPRLTGFYGLEFVKAGEKELRMSFFLRGANFHPNNTKVVCGGTDGDVTIISRELAHVQVIQLTSDLVKVRNGFEVHLATPDGLSNPQYIPVAEEVKKAAPTGYSFFTPGIVPAKYTGPCCGAPSFQFVGEDLTVQISRNPKAVWSEDAERKLAIEITATKLDGTKITFGPNAEPNLLVPTTFSLEYLPASARWSVTDTKGFWDAIERTIASKTPNIGQEDFTVLLTAFIAHEAIGVETTLNKITVPVIGCACPPDMAAPPSSRTNPRSQEVAPAPAADSPTAR